MDIPENKPVLEAPAADLRAEQESLWQLVISILVLVIVVSGTLNIFLARQWKNSRDDLKNARPQTQNLIANYQKGDGPQIEEIVNKLREYGQTHADFLPILNKYGLRPAPAPTPTSPPATSAPAKK
jgi:hypothetical protein